MSRRGALAALPMLLACASAPAALPGGAMLSEAAGVTQETADGRLAAYPFSLATFGAAPYDASRVAEGRQPTDAFRILIDPSFRTGLLVAGTVEPTPGDDIGLFAVAVRPAAADRLYARPNAYGLEARVQHHHARRAPERLLKLVEGLAEEAARPPAPGGSSCTDGTLLFIEVVAQGRVHRAAAHSCDPDFDRLLAAMQPALEDAGALLPPAKAGIAAYARGQFGRFGASLLRLMTHEGAATLADDEAPVAP